MTVSVCTEYASENINLTELKFSPILDDFGIPDCNYWMLDHCHKISLNRISFDHLSLELCR